jgi:hypothetical protein
MLQYSRENVSFSATNTTQSSTLPSYPLPQNDLSLQQPSDFDSAITGLER